MSILASAHSLMTKYFVSYLDGVMFPKSLLSSGMFNGLCYTVLFTPSFVVHLLSRKQVRFRHTKSKIFYTLKLLFLQFMMSLFKCHLTWRLHNLRWSILSHRYVSNVCKKFLIFTESMTTYSFFFNRIFTYVKHIR